MLRAARIKFIAITMLILLGVFLTSGVVIFGLIHKNVNVSTEIALKEMLDKVRPGELSSVEIQRGIIIRTTASGAIDFTYDSNCYDEIQIFDIYKQAVDSGESSGSIGDTFYRIFENKDERLFIAADRSIEKEFESQSATVYFLVLAGSYILLFFIVWGLSYVVFRPIQDAFIKQNQFISDASHELKTPITVIATSLKVLEMETGKQKWIDKAMAQTEKLTSLVNSLVTLSRMDEEDSPLKMEDFPVSDAVRETAESFTDFAASKGHELHLSITDGLTYRGDEYAVRQLVSILLDNAVKYALPDSPIEFSLEKAKRGVVLRSSNACGDVTPENAQKLFDRFYRADPSRSSGSGFGIGLSIARSIAEGHHGSIRAIVDDGKITFTAELK